MKEENIKTGSLKAWLLAARPKTLTGAAVPVMIGLALAWDMLAGLGGGELTRRGALMGADGIVVSVLCLLFAFVMQIDANFINDYFDFMRGNDDETRLGPKRACMMGWVSARQMRRAIAITTVVACLVGLPLVVYGGVAMVLVGAVCVAFCFLYTTHLSYWGLGDLLVLVFFGIVPVCVPYYILVRQVDMEVLVASVACGLVIDTLLMINNYRDLENDGRAGKMTLAVRLGKSASLQAYLALGLGACLMGMVFVLNGHTWAFVMPLVYLVMHVQTYRRMKAIDHGRELNLILGETARNMFVYGLAVSIGVLL